MRSTRPPSRIDRTESRASRDFPSSRFEDAVNWTETRDLKLIARAARTGGVVTTSDLRTCGFSRDTTRAAVRRGLLTRWGRNVYLVGPITDEVTEARAAILAVPHGTLGFDAAAQLAQFGPIAMPPLDVIVAPDRHGERAGVQIRRIGLGPKDVTKYQGLPCTTPAVTIVHLARTLAPVPYERAVQEAFARRLTNTRQLVQALDRHRGGRGTARLRRMLELGVDDLRSKAERSLRHWMRQSGLPLPVFNAEVGPWKVDALWPDHRSRRCRRSTSPRS